MKVSKKVVKVRKWVQGSDIWGCISHYIASYKYSAGHVKAGFYTLLSINILTS